MLSGSHTLRPRCGTEPRARAYLIAVVFHSQLVGQYFVSAYHELHSTNFVSGRRRRRTSLVQIVSEISTTTFELVKPDINSVIGSSLRRSGSQPSGYLIARINNLTFITITFKHSRLPAGADLSCDQRRPGCRRGERGPSRSEIGFIRGAKVESHLRSVRLLPPSSARWRSYCSAKLTSFNPKLQSFSEGYYKDLPIPSFPFNSPSRISFSTSVPVPPHGGGRSVSTPNFRCRSVIPSPSTPHAFR
ncbi:hypothetical protein EVAR_13609_1 [Eumeta japonica]|uniref:Uncharacterized protein n=1 Tax=Eumeta variegata TaxID=151549 RepID=A0A4C1UUM5_EUMVA|nr:hypothetical protein EVAR_13609_1 [Eumeta japonica]